MSASAPPDEHHLHERLLAHDVAAIAEVYDCFAATVFGAALRVTNDRHAAEDVTQDVLLGLWRRPERFDPDRGGMRPWLAAIAHNRGVDWIRREQAARGRDRGHTDLVLAEPVPDLAVDVQVQMTAQRIRAAVEGLPGCEKRAIRMAFFGGRSYRQVAADLNVPEGTVKSRIRSGLHRLSITMYAEQPVT